MQNIYQKNTSIFYAPVWVKDHNDAISGLKNDDRYIPIEKDETPQYLLPYATDIYKNDELYFAFELKSEYIPSLSMYREEDDNPEAELVGIRVSCFATGCILAELFITYETDDLAMIADFSFMFKRATKKEDGCEDTLYDVLDGLLSSLPEKDLFFASNDFKRECRVFHQILSDRPYSEDELDKHLIHLARSYHRNFLPPLSDSNYDMIYKPYFHDMWAGSQEGLINLFMHSSDEITDRFIDRYKRPQLIRNYAFMYLLLLNQRYSAIKLISEISMYNSYTRKEKDKLNRRIVQLKTAFAFNIISDDQLYQNVYRRMYEILDIDRLLEDIRDNEQQVEILQKQESLETEKLSSGILLVISVLSIFSVLIDASSFFDRIPYISEISTALSLGCLALIITLFCILWTSYQKK